MPDAASKNPPAAVAKPTGWDRPLAEINAVVRKAEGGDAAALKQVEELLAVPGSADRLGGNVAKEALRLMVDKFGGKNPVHRAAMTRRIDELRAELLGPDPSTLEKLLVGRVVSCWFHLHYLEAQYAGRESVSLPLGSYYQKSISAAQKRYLAAIRGLAEVRKLALPVLQLNIAKQQVNVAAGTVAGRTSN